MENRGPADQLDHPALRLIAARPEIFLRQGHIAASFRHRNGKTFGPYYRLGYRDGGRQRSIYLGRTGGLVDRVRQQLAALQQPRTQLRSLDQLRSRVRTSLRTEKLRLATLLRPFGLRLKGFEVRGWRFSPLRTALPRPRSLLLRSIAAHNHPNDTQTAEERLTKFLAARDGLAHYPSHAV